MHSQYTVYPARRLIQVRYDGTVSMTFIAARMALLKQDPEFNPLFNVIVDFSRSIFDFDVQEIQTTAIPAHLDVYGKTLNKTAFILDSPESMAFGLLFQNANPDRVIEIFSTRQAAEDWVSAAEQ